MQRRAPVEACESSNLPDSDEYYQLARSPDRAYRIPLMRRSFASLIAILLFPVLVTTQSRGSIPAPESVFGFAAGADYKLATYDQSVEYFKKLAASSRYMKLVE